jgi:nucleoside-diphosphate-sugar epimerase
MLIDFNTDLDAVLEDTRQLWDDITGKTIFITGGTGFFGIWLQMSFVHINRKLNLGSRLVLLTRNKQSFLEKYPWVRDFTEVTFFEGDITNFEFFEGEVDYVIHAATEASVKLNLEQPLTMFETVVNGTKRVLEFARIKKVKSFLLTSSGAVYGNQPTTIENISEDYVGAPVTSNAGSVYGEGKRMAEVLCAVYHKHYSLPVKIARCYAFIGPFLPLDSHFAAGNFINNIINDRPIIIEGDGTPYRSYMYAADLMTWLWTILFAGEENRPYNAGSDQSITIAGLAQMIAATKEGQEVILKTLPSGQPPLRYVPNTDRAVEELGLKLRNDLATSIDKTIAFNKKKPTTSIL